MLALVLDNVQRQRGGIAVDRCAHRAIPFAQVQRVGLGEPHMAIDARALVEPAIAKAGIHAGHDVVLRAVAAESRSGRSGRARSHCRCGR